MTHRYSYIVLRYRHDLVTEEFLNIGVVMLCPELKVLDFRLNFKVARLNKVFGGINGPFYRGLLRQLETELDIRRHSLRSCNLFTEPVPDLKKLVNQVLQDDDSSLIWSNVRYGLCTDPQKEVEFLFKSMVIRYDEAVALPRRKDIDVWKAYRKQFDLVKVLPRLSPKKIITRDYEYQFDNAWLNEQWHCYEPVSFDLMEEQSIVEKAQKWLGRGISLSESDEDFTLYFLLGEPSDPKLKKAAIKAENIMNKMTCKKEFVKESDAYEFTKDVADQMKCHDEH